MMSHDVRFQFAKLFVSRMPLATGESQLRQVFEQFGEVSHCFTTTKPGSKLGGTGFVQFTREFDMESALELDGTMMGLGFEKTMIRVSRARPSKSCVRADRAQAQGFRISLGAVDPLPARWQKASDASGKGYYSNQCSNETTWERPIAEATLANLYCSSGTAVTFDDYTRIKPAIPIGMNPSANAAVTAAIPSTAMSPLTVSTDVVLPPSVQPRWDDTLFRLWSLPATTSMISALQPAPAHSCLEIGCGPGHALAVLRSKLAANAVLVATDVSPAMVKLAMPNAAAVRATVRQADIQALPEEFGTRPFDRVIASLCVHNVPDPRTALRELFRVTVAGGIMAFSVWGRREASSMFTLFPATLQALRAAGELPPELSEVAQHLNFHLGENDEALRRMTQEVGFVNVLSWHVPCLWGTQVKVVLHTLMSTISPTFSPPYPSPSPHHDPGGRSIRLSIYRRFAGRTHHARRLFRVTGEPAEYSKYSTFPCARMDTLRVSYVGHLAAAQQGNQPHDARRRRRSATRLPHRLRRCDCPGLQTRHLLTQH